MKKFKIIYTFIVVLLISACENELDINPTNNLPGELAFNSEVNISSILIGTYEEAGQADSYGGNLQMFTDLLGSSDQLFWNGTFQGYRQAFQKNILNDNIFIDEIWANAYETINQTNLVIDNIETVTSSTEEKNRIEGEAKFLRALNYLDLVKSFGMPYVAGQVNSQLGVPLRLNGIIDYTLDTAIARNTVEEVYTQIIADATDAYNLLPDTSDEFYADKYAAQALLSRTYFQQGNYEAARDAADDVIENSGHSLTSNFASAFNNDNNSSEDIFAFQVTSQTGAHDLTVHYASEADGGRGGDITIEDGYLALFDDANDERANFTYINPINNRRLTLKYTNQFANISIFRIAEMHLIRLESNFKSGTSIGLDPLTEINILRARSSAQPLTSPLTLDLIFNERQLELAFEGFILNDVKRTQQSVGSIAWDDDSLILPIPQSEMDTNPLMVQN
ncbi:RagB/SusD family nutrient uptake outer membrane protein [Cellulophaga sp. HaHaR_3_176]|uniref:RagB/SusD family nutrient uptake outer membrane protein n=1 Tax=Cellulophaga sp. HaHaR_3_176 TaxID=1942464 RepID=UPI001C1F1F7E|nr:RagB/SusD family nutrient uptake outer membrane protein [Cellulophaga sp. HaHaR_3_176]QWX82783.1 RagB/SusD family nutrient uptake outer membrane protein [Cellulophaga sp. HaHaR_3_176]